MITEKDLQEAILECEGQRNPNAGTCLKLAAFYTIRNEMFGKKAEADPAPPMYSYDGPKEKTVDFDGESEFAKSIDGRNAYSMWVIMDELMKTLSIVEPKLYDAVIRKLNA